MLPRPSLGISLAGLAPGPDLPWSAGPRAAIAWAAAAGFQHIQLDAAAPGLRPRELDRSARRDLAAILRRTGLGFCGFDLWIPPEHFGDPARAERAQEAVLQALDCAADLAKLHSSGDPPSVSVIFPAETSFEVLAPIAQAAERVGVRVADHALREPATLAAGIDIGLDPAALQQAGQDPGASAARAGGRLASARLSDASLTGRTEPGKGRLDLPVYLASLSVAGYTRPLILDLRGLSAQDKAARAVLSGW